MQTYSRNWLDIPNRIPARNLLEIPVRIPAKISGSYSWQDSCQVPGRIPANLNISLQIPQGVHTDSCCNLYKKNQIVKGIPARNLVSFSCGNTAVFLLDNFVQEYLQSMVTMFAKFQKYRYKIVGGVAHTRYMYPLSIH